MVKSITNNRKDNAPLSEQETLRIQRMQSPNSTRLQANILNLTQELQQYTADTPASAKRGAHRINFWKAVKPIAATLFAGVVAVVISSGLWFPADNDQLVVEDFTSLTVDRLEEEIAWQDILLLQDELAFAGL